MQRPSGGACEEALRDGKILEAGETGSEGPGSYWASEPTVKTGFSPRRAGKPLGFWPDK